MTNNELKDLRWLPGEIKILERHLEETRPLIKDRDPRMRKEAAALIAFYRRRIDELQAQYNRGIDFIDAIPDADTRIIFELRYITGMSWFNISDITYRAERTAKKIVQRYLDKTEG